ncbi:MAG: hypothetical protein KDB00_12995 [Planctomycetales bacterium]|nr:hypothetical protein [Planctomycetales bacterium]
MIHCDLRNATSNPSANPLIQADDVIVSNALSPESQSPHIRPVKPTYSRIPILGATTQGGSPVAGNPPTDTEILSALKEAVPSRRVVDVIRKGADTRIVKEKIADYIDPPRFYPLIGPAHLHHAHYKCTIYFNATGGESVTSEVVYIDHNHFHLIASDASP